MPEYHPYTALSRAMTSNQWMPIAYVQCMSEQFHANPEYYTSGQFKEDSFKNFPRIVSELKFDEFYESIFWLMAHSAISKDDFQRAHDLMIQVESIIKKIPHAPDAFGDPPAPENATGG